ncbi:leucyl aminopeptidase [Calditrichota bacterium LG25]
MFQIATVSDYGLNSHLLVIMLTEAYVKKRKKDFSVFPPCIQQDMEWFFSEMKDFKGKFKETLLFYPKFANSIQRVLLIGMGDSFEPDAVKFREVGSLIQAKQKHIKSRRNHIYLGNLPFCTQKTIEQISEGILYKQYVFDELKSEEKAPAVDPRYIYVCGKYEYSPKFRQSVIKTRKVMHGVYLARNLANKPSNIATPLFIKDAVVKHFKPFNHCTVEVFDRENLEKAGMNALLAVSQGSKNEPYLLIIKYVSPEAKKSLALVGKGVTFDSGGISLKPSANMHEMKYDMAGAAAVIGAMDYIVNAKPRINVYGVIPLVENMPGGRAIRPGDVVKAYNGKTIEILNTDAEGRLILADAIAFAIDRLNPGLIIDFATLTGSCMVALGDKRAGLFSNSESLRQALYEAGEESGDLLWPMPTDAFYHDDLKSEIADIANIGGRWGGAITAAKFLEFFVDKVAWAHIDMAGTANDIKHFDFLGKGATGFGVRLIAAALKKLNKLA